MNTVNGQSTSAMNLMDIPNEITVKIFSNVTTKELDALQLVNIRCYNLVKLHIWPLIKEFNGITWNNELNVSEHLFWPHYSSERLVSYFKRCNKIEKLQITLCLFPNFTLKLYLLPRLTYIKLSSVSLQNRHLEAIAADCPKLKGIYLEYCFTTTNVDFGLGVLFRSCTELELLNIYWAKDFYGDFLTDLPSTLRCLVLGRCYKLRVQHLNAFFNKNTNLEAFDVSFIENVGVEDVNHWYRHMPKLRYLDTEYLTVNGITDVKINYDHMPHLEILKFPHCEIKNLPRLSKLVFLSTKRGGPLTFAMAPSLKYFQISNYSSVASKIELHDNLEYLSFEKVKKEGFYRIAEALHSSKNLKYCEIITKDSAKDFLDAARKFPENRNGKSPVVVGFLSNTVFLETNVPKWIVLRPPIDESIFDDKGSYFNFWNGLNIF